MKELWLLMTTKEESKSSILMSSLILGIVYLKDTLVAVMMSSTMEECSLLVVQSKRSLTL